MLSRLYIKNIALISEADIEFCDRLNVLSGETGSGKSVILDSINFVLGSKADKTMIRHGETEAQVRAEFTVSADSPAAKALEEYDIECDGDIIITRKFNADGKGAIKVNGNAVTAAMLKNLTQKLVDVHGQSEHFFLLNEDNQLNVIDGLLDGGAAGIKGDIAKILAEKREIKSKIAELGGNESERERTLDLLKYQINEIESAGVKEGEFEALKARQNVLNNVERIMTALNAAKNLLDADGGCCDGLASAARCIDGVSDVGDEYAQILTRLESLSTEASDISETITDLAENLSYDEGEAQTIDERLSLLKGLMKKYGADEAGIIAFADNAKAKYETLSDAAAAIEKYAKDLEKCNENIFALCKKLTKARKDAARAFCSGVESELKSLNIPNAKFEVKFADYDENTANLNSPNGADKVSFEFSANKGEPLKPLNKVISGGEMSRFMLAIKTRLKGLNGISTYIFDEIDAGISGFTAKTVADKFVKISDSTQIIAVSHLPQVCAASDSQYLIYKCEEGGKTLTKVKRLTAEEKIDEIVRLTGNVKSAAARENAIELIKQFEK